MEIMKIPKTKREIDGKIRAHFQFKNKQEKTHYDMIMMMYLLF